MPIEVSTSIYEYLSSLYSKDSADNYLKFISEEPTQYIRVNRLKTDKRTLAEILKEKYSIHTEEIQGFDTALKIVKDENEVIGKTLEHLLGLYYVQGLSSMLPPLVLNPSSNDIVLDLCSAPGSKTTQMAEMMNNDGTLIVNEIEIDRIKSLVFNLDRLSIVNTGIIHSKGEILSKYYHNHFDKILVDAPCSGLGIIQKKEEVSNWWSIERVQRLQDLQTRLLIAAIKLAKVGGEIVYSTCTLSVEENEMVIDKILSKYPVEIEEINLPVLTHPAFTSYNGKEFNESLSKAIRILPWEINSDGFFLVKLRKTGDTEPSEPGLKKEEHIKLLKPTHKEISPLLDYINDHFGIPKEVLYDYKYIEKGRDIFFITTNWNEYEMGLFHRVGIKFGTLDKKNRITFYTSAAQVLEKHITKFVYDIKDEEELKNYLTGWKIKNSDIPAGQYVMRYKGRVLGTALANEEGIKSRFPRTKRTQKFVIGAPSLSPLPTGQAGPKGETYE